MVRISSLLPSHEAISYISHIRGKIRVLKAQNLIGGATELFLCSSEGHELAVTADYTDVVFKFECFGIKVDYSLPRSCEKMLAVDKIDDWREVSFLFRFEWEEVAKPGEVPVGWEPFVRFRGKSERVPDAAIGIGVSMVGIIFEGVDQGAISGLIAINDSDPATLLFTKDVSEIKKLKDECDYVGVAEIEDWLLSIKKWIDQA